MINKKHRYTDHGNAELFCMKYGETVKFNHALKKWIMWDGKRWVEDSSNKVLTLAAEAIKSLLEEASNSSDNDEVQKISKWAGASLGAYRIKSMLILAQPLMAVEPKIFDTDKFKFNVQNGTIDLRSGKLLSHCKEDYITKISSVIFRDGVNSNIWLEFLNKIFCGDAELIKYIQKAIGYSLCGSTKEQCIFIMFGLGANGKSTFIKALLNIFGDYGTQTPTETLMVKKNEGIRNDIARLHAKRFVSASEGEKNQSLAEALVKQLTGEDTISARFMYKEYFEFTPEFKVFLITNHKPRISGVDHGIWRRLRPIPFSVTISEEDKDLELQNKLKEESSGILNWAIEGVLLWQKEGLRIPLIVNEALKEYKSENDFIYEFIDKMCTITRNVTIKKSVLHTAYTDYCSVNGIRNISLIAFGKTLRDRGFKEREQGDGSYWLDIGIKPVDSSSS